MFNSCMKFQFVYITAIVWAMRCTIFAAQSNLNFERIPVMLEWMNHAMDIIQQKKSVCVFYSVFVFLFVIMSFERIDRLTFVNTQLVFQTRTHVNSERIKLYVGMCQRWWLTWLWSYRVCLTFNFRRRYSVVNFSVRTVIGFSHWCVFLYKLCTSLTYSMM